MVQNALSFLGKTNVIALMYNSSKSTKVFLVMLGISLSKQRFGVGNDFWEYQRVPVNSDRVLKRIIQYYIYSIT